MVTGVMESKANKGKEIEVAGKGLKRLQKCTKGSSSSSAKGAPARMFGERAVEPHGLSWFNQQKKVKYDLEN
ncbi:hypothetical protein HAX54_050771 [Datura stramonium]|uniref:Uncharacterized protein n=1 Tax=Datura stramonium TaxID=4076 RepID=A0ABS8SXF3_DATST|nr:hypothetical protein [Datura stramonium]